jgi:hypothetical protein
MRVMPRRIVLRWATSALGGLGALICFSGVDAAELVMFRREGCVWCARWDREIGTIYSRTDLGRRAPLRMVDLDRGPHPVRTRGRIVYTPTFVLAENGEELGRIEGYPGNAFFWGLLEQLLEQAPPRQRPKPLGGGDRSGEAERVL